MAGKVERSATLWHISFETIEVQKSVSNNVETQVIPTGISW